MLQPSKTAEVFTTVERILRDHQTGLWSLDKIMGEVRRQTIVTIQDDDLLEMIAEVRMAQAVAAMFSDDKNNGNSDRTQPSSLE